MKILVTGGAGYIGSHTVLSLLAHGFSPVIVDNFSNSQPAVLDRLRQISGAAVPSYEADVTDAKALDEIFSSEEPDAVIHFAGLKAVGESTSEPLRYYENNVFGTLSLLKVMAKHGVKRLVFSSSATVYGDAESMPIAEHAGVAPTNPYGHTKAMCEQVLRDTASSDLAWRIEILRYFNPVGAHPSGLIGEDPLDVPNNLVPYVAQVAVGRRSEVSVFGNDYDTKDGTGVRDYLHVMDLADAHVKAVAYQMNRAGGVGTFNLGTGQGHSVLDVIRAFEQASGRKISYRITARRAGDIATCYADPSLAKRELGWEATRSLDDMCVDSWRWQSLNPSGFAKPPMVASQS